MIRVLAVLASLALAFTTLGCAEEEGPAERAGKQLDKAMEKTAEHVEGAVEDMKEAAEEATDS